QRSRTDSEVDLRRLPGGEMHPLESSKHTNGCLKGPGLREVKLDHFVARDGARVGYGCLHFRRLPSGQYCRTFQVAVGECGVAESVAKRVKRPAGKILVCPPLHRILREVGNLPQRGIER